MISILIDTRWIGSYGIGRIATEVSQRISGRVKLSHITGLPLLHPLEPIWLSYKIAHQKPDVYYSPGYNPPLHSSSPFVFTICDLIYLRFPQGSGLKQKAYYQFVVLPAAKRADFIITISEFSRQELLEWGKFDPEKVKVVFPAVGVEFTPYGKKYSSTQPYILFVGNFKPHKNLNNLLLAFQRSGLHKDFQLVLAGVSKKKAAGLVNDMGLMDKVVFPGFVPNEQLPSIYRGASLTVLPSFYEGFGIPALESLSCGVPLIASNSTSIPEVVGDAGLYFDPHQIDDIARSMKQAIYDDELRKRLLIRGLEQVKKFSWEQNANETLEILQLAAKQ